MKMIIITGIILYIAWLGVLYSAIAFYQNCIDFHQWEDGARFIFAMFGIFCGSVAGGIVTGIELSKNKK